jgi:DNA-binding LacI/PurR family transcriptional regulator
MDSSEKEAGRKKKSSRPTAKDIARLAGVSQSTVSRILAGNPSNFFSQQTRQRVMGIAEELSYSPDPVASALRNKQTKLIGLIIRSIFDPFFATLVSEISLQARACGYQTLLGNSETSPSEVLKLSSVLDIRQTAGVIILGDWWDDKHAIQDILSEGNAVVTMCHSESQTDTITINTDNRAGIKLLLDHLIQLGHYKYGFLQGCTLGDFNERLEAFLEYLHVMGIQTNHDWLINDTDDITGGYRAMVRILEMEDRPTAVLVADDLMAIGALKAANDAGVWVPEDISITGFDNIELASFVSPALTTVQQPIDVMAKLGVDYLLAQIQGEPTPSPRFVRLQPRLFVRESTGSVNLKLKGRRLPKK